MPTTFQKKFSSIALDQFDRFHLLREQQQPLAGQIQKYWEALGLTFPGVDVPWSAVFVSWCAKQAGATAAQFQFSPQHSVFVFAAIKNATTGTGVFRGHTPATFAPRVADIIHNNRSGNHFDFAFAKTHRSYESHSAIVVEAGSDTAGQYVRTIGGNEGDSVGLKEIRLNAGGMIKDASGLYISVIETLL